MRTRDMQGRPDPHWMQHALDRLQSDRALFALAEMDRAGWCADCGGAADDPVENLKLRCALEPAAQRLLDKLIAMPADDRRAVAHRLWPSRKEGGAR